jgi:transcription antitermination factor NusG
MIVESQSDDAMIALTSEIGSEGRVEWNAIYTRHQHEKTAAESLAGSGFEVFLPTYSVVRQWTDRKKQLSLPLFPCYVFVRSNFERRLRVLATPGVHFLVMFAGRPAAIPDLEMDAIRKAVESKLRVEPHPFLRYGDMVRVTSGPLVDVEGILVRKKGSYRLILSAELLGKSIAVEIDAFSVRPLPRRSTTRPLPLAQPEPFAKHRVAG